MAEAQLTTFCRRLRGILGAQGEDAASDQQLLYCFVADRDEAAFAALVRRHGPMVLGLCQRLLRDSHDADDAFQATFIVLARKAAGLRRGELLTNWLYGVAYRTALKARRAAARRRRHEKEASPMMPTELDSEPVWRELRPVIDEELQHLPQKYRTPILLCYFEGKTHEEAATLLGWPKGTVAGRLARARNVLRQRLVRRGVTLSAVVLASTLSAQAASASVPSALLTSTVQAAIGAGTVSLTVAALSKGVLFSMLMSKFKSAALIVAAVAVAGVGVGMMSQGGGFAGVSQAGDSQFSFRAGRLEKEDKDLIQGTWKVVSAEHGGEKAPDDQVSVMRLVFSENKITLKAADEERPIATFTLNPKSKPKAIDLTHVEDSKEKKTAKGIYELDGNNLKLTFSEGDGDIRPSAFSTEKGTRQVLFVMKRVEKDEPANPEDVKKFKETAARQISANNLKQIALAMHNYHATYNHLPTPAICSKAGQPLLSWRVTILPYIEQDNLYKQFHLDEPWDSEHNKRLLTMMPKTYEPVLGKTKEPNCTYYRVFVGSGAIFEEKKETRFTDITDGTSNTVLAVEAGEAVPWTKPDELPFGAGTPLPKLGGQFKDSFPIAIADGSVHFIDLKVGDKLRPFITRAGGEVVNFDDLRLKK